MSAATERLLEEISRVEGTLRSAEAQGDHGLAAKAAATLVELRRNLDDANKALQGKHLLKG